MKMADLMESEGYLAAGYNILSLDDCWMDHMRTPEGKLQPDASRFPSGIKALADYVCTLNLLYIDEQYNLFILGLFFLHRAGPFQGSPFWNL